MSKLPTPNYEINPDQKKSVYPPSEDTFLLMDALEKEQETLHSIRPIFSVEIGSGSGVVTVFLRQLLSKCPIGNAQSTSSASPRLNLISICTDLNKKALECTKNTAQINSIGRSHLELIRCNILDPLISRVGGSVDILLLNPPYVPMDESAKDEMELCYAGGTQGRDLLNKLLPHVAQILSPNGLFYLVVLKENGIDELTSQDAMAKFGINPTIVLERQCRNEHLYVLKFRKNAIGRTEPEESQISQPSVPITPQPSEKITIVFKAVGAAPQLQKKYTQVKAAPSWTISYLEQILRKWLGIKPADSLYLFVKQAFVPNPEHTIEVLRDCFGSRNGVIHIDYSITPAWG